jgi:VCBS repeat protein
MKAFKISALAFAVALAACGGGGGGGSGDSGGNDGGNALPSSPRASLIVDVNNDGLNDLVIDTGDSDSVSSARDLLLINQGGLSFESRPDAFPARFKGESEGYQSGVTVAFSHGDFNGDDHVDIILIGVSEFYEESHLQLFLGDGEGGFTDGSDQITPNNFGIFGGWPEWIRVADFDGDGFDDFILTTPSSCENYCGKIYLNDGSGNLAPATIDFTDVSSSYSDDILTWDTNGGQGDSTSYSPLFTDILLGDVNNDTKPDLVAAPYGGPIPSFINTSTPGALSFDVDYSIVGAGFLSGSQPEIKNGVLADLNGDGFPDLVGSKSISPVDGETTPVHAYLNDGTGVFDLDNDLVVSGVGVYHARQWQAADVDGDGYDEVIIADHGEDYYPYSGRPNLLLDRNASGDVVDRAGTALSAGRSYSHGLASGDLNGDGAVDLFFNNDWFEEMGTEREAFIWVNKADGSGDFEQAHPILN